MLLYFSTSSSFILLLLIAVAGAATPTSCHCHQQSSSSMQATSSRGNCCAFIGSSRVWKKKSLKRDYTKILFVVKHSINNRGEEFAVSSLESINEENSDALGRRRWIRDMLVFGSNAIAARSASASTGTSSSDTYTTSDSPSAGVFLPSNAATCGPTIDSYRKGSFKIHIVGTAHVSSASAELAGAVVKERRPRAVFVELDPQRINRAFRNGHITQPTNIIYFSESKRGEVTLKTATLLPQELEKKSKGLFRLQNPIQDMYEGLEAQGITPGEEFITAVEEGIRSNSIIVLGDRPMDITLRRLAKALFFDTDPKKLAEADKIMTKKMKDRVPELEEWERQMKESGQQTKVLSPEEFAIFVERLKTKETTMALMDEVKKAAPALYEALVGERDIFMGRAMNAVVSSLPSLIPPGLSSLTEQEMISVVGLGHMQGIGRELMSSGWTKFTPATCKRA